VVVGTDPAMRRRGFLYLAILLAGIALAVAGRRLPEARAYEAPPEEFSAGRALRVLERIAVRPHPVGSENHECVRDLVREELLHLGLVPEEMEGASWGRRLANFVVRIPGYDSTGTVLCMAHYDSVPTGPGAGDDGVGLVTWLEGFRALAARGWMPRNDVVLLLSDGEELGLLGAHLFAAKHPLAEDVRTVVNLEAIGNGGAAVLFQLGPENGARVRLFRDEVAAPTGTSLADAVYRAMPNDTDLSVFLERGVGGFNLALATGSAAYHAPHDTPANLDPRSLQHMGDCAVAVLEAASARDLATLTADDVTFFDVLGRFLVVWPRAWDLLLWLLGAALTVHAVRRSGESPRALASGGVLLFCECAFVASLLFAVAFAVDRCIALFAPEPSWVPGNTTSGALVFGTLALAAPLLVAARSLDAPERGRSRSLAGLVGLALASLWSMLALPGASFALTIPLLAAATTHATLWPREARGGGVLLLRAAMLALPAVVGLPILHQLAQLFQRTPDHATALLALVLALIGAPFLPQLGPVVAALRLRTGKILLLAALGFLAASTVARLLVWRQGALLP